MKSILPKQTISNGGTHTNSVVGPGTKVILLKPVVPTVQQNLDLSQGQLLTINTYNCTIAQPTVAPRQRRAKKDADKWPTESKYEPFTIAKSKENARCVKGITEKDTTLLPPEDLQMVKDFITSYMANPDILLTPQLAFYKKFIKKLGAKVPTSRGKKGYAQMAGPKKHEKPKVEVDPSKEYQCSQCDRVYISSYHLQSHMKIHNEDHNDGEEKPYMCNICGKRFRLNVALTSHMLKHTGDKPYKCNQCDRAFKSKILLINHTRMIHTGERPYKCRHCDKAFSVKFKLKTHMFTHTGVKPYKCIKCHKAFVTKGNLKVHMIIHTGEKQYKCKQCGKAFAHNSVLTKHMRTHTGERPYQCTQCGTTFAWKGHLIGHMRIHTGERPYQCNQCGNSFAQRYSLKKHARTHTGERPYQCSHCDKNFKYSSSLNEHMKNIHSNNAEVASNPTQLETRCDENLKNSIALNENIKINSDNTEVTNNTTVITSHVHNAENAYYNTVHPMAGIQEYSRYPWYNGRVGWDTFQKTHNPGYKNYCLFRVEQGGTDNGVRRASP